MAGQYPPGPHCTSPVAMTGASNLRAAELPLTPRTSPTPLQPPSPACAGGVGLARAVSGSSPHGCTAPGAHLPPGRDSSIQRRHSGTTALPTPPYPWEGAPTYPRMPPPHLGEADVAGEDILDDDAGASTTRLCGWTTPRKPDSATVTVCCGILTAPLSVPSQSGAAGAPGGEAPQRKLHGHRLRIRAQTVTAVTGGGATEVWCPRRIAPRGYDRLNIATKTHPARGDASAHASRIDQLIAGRSSARHKTGMSPLTLGLRVRGTSQNLRPSLLAPRTGR